MTTGTKVYICNAPTCRKEFPTNRAFVAHVLVHRPQKQKRKIGQSDNVFRAAAQARKYEPVVLEFGGRA